MTVYAVLKNDVVINGRLFALPGRAFDFFCDNFKKDYPFAKLDECSDDLLTTLKNEKYLYVLAEHDEYEIKTFVRFGSFNETI